MSYCVTAPAIATGACCSSCAAGGPCDSQGLGAVPIKSWFWLGAAALIAYMALGGTTSKRANEGPKEWYVYSREPGTARAEFTHGPYTQARARAQRTRERRMGLVATMRKKR